MNQIDTGKFIAECRKEKGFTQAQLAEKLNITDRAVSKWETGKCMPDSSIMLELCQILDISVNELLSGERMEMEKYNEKANENLIELKRKDEDHINKNTVIAMVFTVTAIIGIMVCCICDFAVSGNLTWSLITLSAISFVWIISFPMILLGKRGIQGGMLSVSIFLIPFLYILGMLLKVPTVFRIGAKISVITLLYLWCIYGLYVRLKSRKLLATGITFAIAIPFVLIINISLSKMIGEPVIDVWDILSVFILLVVSFAFGVADYAQKKGLFKNSIS